MAVEAGVVVAPGRAGRGRRRPGGDPGLPMGAAWRPCPAGRFRLARPGAAPRPARRGESGRGPGRPRSGTPWVHPGAEASVPQPARPGTPSTSAPPPPFPALALRSPSGPGPAKKGISFSCPSTQRSCQLCPHQPSLPLEGLSQSLATRGGGQMEIAWPCRCPNFTKDAGHLGLGVLRPVPQMGSRAGVRGGSDSSRCVPGHIGMLQAHLEGESSLRLLTPRSRKCQQ